MTHLYADDIFSLGNEKGQFERPVAAGTWRAPTAVGLRKGMLLCPTQQEWHEVHPGPGMLEEFVRLADARDERIRDYTLRWGMLEVCKQHRLPFGHSRIAVPGPAQPLSLPPQEN